MLSWFKVHLFQNCLFRTQKKNLEHLTRARTRSLSSTDSLTRRLLLSFCNWVNVAKKTLNTQLSQTPLQGREAEAEPWKLWTNYRLKCRLYASLIGHSNVKAVSNWEAQSRRKIHPAATPIVSLFHTGFFFFFVIVSPKCFYTNKNVFPLSTGCSCNNE